MTNLSRVGKYEVKDLIGEGAMGVVYRAVDPMLNRSVAVKVMNEALALDENFRTRFLREARAAGSLQHPNVITVYDCGETEGHLYIAMEFVAGTDLEQLIASKVPLTVSDKINIIIGVLNGLAYAHKRGIVHRDMKPANIRVNEEGRALIMDFGIAYTESSNVTKTGLILGTPNYMAPEQVTGGAITAQTDIFAVGVVLYELLTNIKPFEAGTLHNVLFRIVSEMPEPPDKVVTGLRADLAEVVMKALAKEPSARYTSALEMANALSAVSAAMLNSSTGGKISKTLSLRSSIELALNKEEEARNKEKEELARKRAWQRAGVAAGALLAVGATLYALRGRAAPREATTAIAQQPTASVAATVPAATPQPVTPAPSTPTPSSAEPPPVARTATKPNVSAPPPDMTLALSLQSKALQDRRRAADAGAGAAQLALGDRHSAAGDQFLRKRLRDDAMREFTQASLAFGNAGEAARVAVTTAPAPSTPAIKDPVKEQTREQAKAPPVISVAPPPVQPPPAQPVGNPSAEIAAVVERYAKAIESRDVGELKRVYPGMSASEASNWDDFFRRVRSIRATFSMSNLLVDGSSADARLHGTYEYVGSNGRTENIALTLQATLRKDGGDWRFVSIKQL
jgi:serine/threonine-protein kinase